VFEAIGGIANVFIRPGFEFGAFFGGEFANDFRGRAEDEGAGGYFGADCNQGVGADEALVANGCTIENGCAHADEDFVADGARVDYGGVANGDVVAYDAGIVVGEVEDGVVLNVGVVTNDDAVDVAASNSVVPDAGMVAEGDVAEDDRAFGDVNIFAEGRFFVEESLKLFLEFIHERESSHELLKIHEKSHVRYISSISWCGSAVPGSMPELRFG
jgi:hypothetical protein